MADDPKKDDVTETPAQTDAPGAATGEPEAPAKEVEELKRKGEGAEGAAKPKSRKKAESGEKAAAEPKPKKAAAKAKPAPKAESKAKAESKPKAEAESKAKADSKVKGKAESQPEAESKPKSKAKPKSEPAAKAPEAGSAPKTGAKAAKAADSAKAKAPGDAPAARTARRGGRSAEPAVLVRAHAKYVRSSARKARLVCDAIRGKDVPQARAILAFHPRAVAEAWEKLLESAIANAENNHDLDGDDLRVHSVFADEGPTIKRFRPRAMGRATRIRKRTSHLTIQLAPKETR